MTAARVHRRQGLSRNEERYRLTRPRTEKQAERIRAYWEAKGHEVRVWVEPLSDTNSVEWVVRSSLSLTERRP